MQISKESNDNHRDSLIYVNFKRKSSNQEIAYPKVDLNEWCLKYKLKPRFFKCRDCGVNRVTDIPVDYGFEAKGLASGFCKNCNSKSQKYITVFINGEIQEEVNRFLNSENY